MVEEGGGEGRDEGAGELRTSLLSLLSDDEVFETPEEGL